MHWLPYGPGLDILLPKGEAYRLAVNPSHRRINGHTGQPMGAAAIGRFRHKGDSRNIPECICVIGLVTAPGHNPVFKHPQLAATDRRQDIAQPIVESQFGMLVMRSRIFRLGGPKTHLFRHFLARGN